MKCYACGGNFPLSRWRTINIKDGKNQITKRSKTLSSKPINYYTPAGVSQYGNIYACPYCGTLKVKTPIDRN